MRQLCLKEILYNFGMDDRDWNQKRMPRFPTLKQYVEDVIHRCGRNSEEFHALVKVYGLVRLEKILEGKSLKEVNQPPEDKCP